MNGSDGKSVHQISAFPVLLMWEAVKAELDREIFRLPFYQVSTLPLALMVTQRVKSLEPGDVEVCNGFRIFEP